MLSDVWKKSPLDRIVAISLGIIVTVVAYWTAPKVIDYRIWQPFCEGALLRPPELFMPGLYRLIVYALTRFCGINVAVRVLCLAGPVALGVVAYHAMMLTMSILVVLLRVDRVRPDFRNVMMPILTAVGMGLFLLSCPVLHASWMLTPSILILMLAFVTMGAVRSLFVRSDLIQGYFGIFLAGMLSAECLLGVMIMLCAMLVGYVIVMKDDGGSFVLSNPYVYHVTKWTFSVLYLLGVGSMLAVNAWFFDSHGGLWEEAFRGFFAMPDVNSVAIMVGMVFVPLAVALTMMPRSSDNEAYLPYVNGLLLLLVAFISVTFCVIPETVTIKNECAKMFMLFVAALTAVAALLTLLVDVYCRVQTHYSKVTRAVTFRIVIVALSLIIGLMVVLDGTRKISLLIDQCADEAIAESAGMKRLFSDGAMDGLLEIKSAQKGGRLRVHSMFGGRSEYAAKLRMRDVSGDDDVSMMRIGASVALGSWVSTGSQELMFSAVQLGFEVWKRGGKPMPKAGGLMALPSGCNQGDCDRFHAWVDGLSDRILAGCYDRAYARCREKRLRESFDMIKWRIGRMLELRALECERQGENDKARLLRNKSNLLDRRNRSLAELRGFMNLVWNQDNMQLTPREALKIALDRANFRAARPHAEAVISSDPDDARANFALGMYHYVARNFERADLYLSTAHKVRPADPAIINNLAIVRMYLNKLESAEQLALEALKIKPEAKEVQSTLSEIRRRMNKE